MRTNPSRLLSILSLAIGVEGLLAAALTAMIPGEAGSAALLGLSAARLAVVLPLAVLSLAAFLLASAAGRLPGLANCLLNPQSAAAKAAAAIVLVSCVFVLLPPYELAVTFGAYHRRLLYFFIWLGMAAGQFLGAIFVIRMSGKGWRNWLAGFPARNRAALFWGFSFLFPILLMTPRLWIFNGLQIGVGNDFVPFSYFYKVYLLDFLAHFKIPLWSPSEAAGFPYLASPHTQTLYPLNIPLAAYYWWKGSYGLLDHAWFTVLGMSIFSTGMFAWLRQFSWRESSALLAAVVISVSFRVTELIRFPWSVHTIAWLPWMLYFITRLLKNPREKQPLKVYLGLGFSVFCFITGGYLYYQYYSIFLLFPYFLIITINKARQRIGFEAWQFSASALLKLAAAVAAPVLLLLPYLVHVLILLRQVETRGQVESAAEISNYLSFNDLAGALVFPPITSPETWFYIGYLPLILIIHYFCTSRPGRSRGKAAMDGAIWYLSPAVKISLAVLLLFLLSFMLGGSSPLFRWMWEHFPFFSFIKNWGRINILLIPPLGFALAAGLEAVHYRIQRGQMLNTGLARRGFAIMAAAWAILMGLLFYAQTQKIIPQWHISFYLLTSRLYWFYASLALAGLLILYVFILTVLKKMAGLRPLAFLFLLVVIADLAPIGANQWPIAIIPEENPPGRLNLAEKVIPRSFLFPRTIGKTNISITPVFSYGTFSTWYFREYTTFFNNHQFERERLEELMGAHEPARKIYLSRSINHNTVADFLSETAAFPGAFQVDYYDGEVLVVEVDARESGYLSFIDNWDPFWTAGLDGEPREIELLFGTFKSVRIPAGKSSISFVYRPQLLPLDLLIDHK